MKKHIIEQLTALQNAVNQTREVYDETKEKATADDLKITVEGIFIGLNSIIEAHIKKINQFENPEAIKQLQEFVETQITERRPYTATKSFEVVLEKMKEIGLITN